MWLDSLLLAYAENVVNSWPCCWANDHPGELGSALSQVVLDLLLRNEHP